MAGLAPQNARADVNSVTPTPASVSLPFSGTQAQTVSLTWRVARTQQVAGPSAVTTSSPQAELIIDGSRAAVLGNALTQTGASLIRFQTETLTFQETLSLSPALIRRISKAPAGTAFIRRSFNDTQTTASGDVSLFISSNNAGALTVNRIALSFENQARTDVVNMGDSIRAVADVTFIGNGLLRGEWRLVDPTASLGSGRGRVLHAVRQQLVSSGEGRQRIVSPPLPTDLNGLYLLSFSVQDTTAGFEIPVLRYFVLEGGADTKALEMTALTPTDGAYVLPETAFSWLPLASAQAYEVEILGKGADEKVTSKLVPAEETKLTLSALSFEDLQPGTLYDWRVRALAQGKVIGLSPKRTLKTP